MIRTASTWTALVIISLAQAGGGAHGDGPAGRMRSVAVSFGARVQSSGLLPVAELPGDGHRIGVIQGQQRWGTDNARGLDGLGLRAGPRFSVPGMDAVPITLTVEYFDHGAGGFVVQYEARAHGRRFLKQTTPVMNSNARLWKTARLGLPDAALSASAGWYLRIASQPSGPTAPDVFVRRVEARIGGVRVEVDPPVLGADGASCAQVTIWVLAERDGAVAPPADGTIVSLAASKGAIRLTSRMKGGVASAALRAAGEPGWVTVTAECEGLVGRTRALLWPGNGPGVAELTLIDDFGDLQDWSLWGPDATWTWTRATVGEQRGGHGGRLTYALTPNAAGATLDVNRRVFLRGLPWTISFWLKDDGSGNALQGILQDATGQLFVVPLTWLRQAGWRRVQAPLYAETAHAHGANDGRFNPPVSFLGLRLARHGKTTGELVISDLVVTTLAPGG